MVDVALETKYIANIKGGGCTMNRGRVSRTLSRRLVALAIVVGIVSFGSTDGFGANYPLQITNIKPAGTGNPAIPSTNRIFRAYPGIEYNIRPAIAGGAYPFSYALSGQPSGMTINAATGEISWPNPQSNSGTITVTVTDRESTVVSASWTVNVGTSGFYFVDSNAATNGNGSIATPFNTMVGAVYATPSTGILYFRGGTYDLVHTDHNTGEAEPTYGVDCAYMYVGGSLGGSAAWIGYPGETAVIHGNNTYVFTPLPLYWDNLSFGASGAGNGFNHRALQFYSNSNYITIRRCKFTNIVNPARYNNNQSFMICYMDGQGYYLTIQDNDFSYYRGATCIGSLYSRQYTVIDGNYFHDGGQLGANGGIFAGPIFIKRDMWYTFIRNNRAIQPSDAPSSMWIYNSYSGEHLEFDHNLVVQLGTGSRKAFDIYWTPNLYIHHNTIVGDILDITQTSAPPTCGHTDHLSSNHSFYSNVIINPNTGSSGWYGTWDFFSFERCYTSSCKSCISDTNNLKSTTTVNVIDASYKLVNRSFVGTYGWETGQVAALKAPTNLIKTSP